MPRIDPLQLLNCLNVLLTPTGGIKSEQEVSRISSLMEKFSKKLVSKCVYLLILKASDVHLLSMFMAANGWNLIYSWLVQAIEAKNYPFLFELLEVIIICPVDIERLKSNPMPRQIKYLSKDNSIDPKVKELASDIVKHWLAIVKGAPAMNQSNTSVPEPDSTTNTDHSATSIPHQAEVVNTQPSEADESDAPDGRISSNDSLGEEDERDDGNYVKSTSPSSDSLNESDDQDEFIPYKKQSPATSAKKKAAKAAKMAAKKDKSSRKSNTTSVDKVQTKLKSKLVNDTPSKDQGKAPIKLKIKKKLDDEQTIKKPRIKPITDSASAAEKTLEEKLKEKRRQREEKEREKFARLKHEREKKELKMSTSKDKRDKLDKLNKDKLDEKAKGDLSKLIPKPLDKLGRIPKLSSKEGSEPSSASSKPTESNENDRKLSDDKKTSKKDDATRATIQRLKEEREREAARKEAKKAAIPVPPKKPVSMSVEKRFAAGEAKPKTVKAFNSKFRLTGLEQEIPKPPSRKPNTGSSAASSSSTPAPPVTTAASSNAGSESPEIGPVVNDKNAVKRSPTKDIEIEPVEKKMKSPEISLEEKSPQPLKNKKPFLQESDDFMNAMNAAVETQKELLRKRKKPAAKNDDSSSPTPKTPDGKEAKPSFKFYKDTLESSVDESLNETVAESLPDKSPPEEKDISAGEEIKPAVIKSAEGLKSALSLFRKRNQPKKSVKWRTDDELEAVQFFEVDVSERANVVKDFWAMQMKERSGERESMLMVRKAGDNDKMVEKMAWKKLVPIDVPPPSTAKGANSQEKNIQYARERTVPPALYYSKSMIPDTPAEPDLEIHSITQPPTIPLDDISGSSDSVNDFSTFKWPEPKQFPPDGSEFMPPNFMPGAVPPPMFAFPDGSTFPPPFTQPFFPGGPVPPGGTWPTGTTDQSQQPSQSGQPMQWMRPPFDGVPPPNMVPPVGPGMMAPPPPFGMMAPVFPFPGAPNMFPPPGMTPPITTSNSTDTNAQFSPTNNYSNNSDSSSSSSSKKWNSEDRYNRKDWKNNFSSDRSGRDKRGSGTWRAGGGNTRLCKYYQKKGFCNLSGCRFYHPEK